MRGQNSLLSRRAFVLGPVLLIALISSGCGGGSDPTGTTETIATSLLAKPAWIKRVEAICVKGTEPILGELTAYEEKHSQPFGPSIKAVLPPAVRREIHKIRAIGAPEGDEQSVEAFLRAFGQDAGAIEHEPPMKSQEELEAKFKHSGPLARKNGIEACAYG
jgi:hypothetical protein